MADEKDVKVDENAVATEISYCPDLGLYHYMKCDGEEAFFTTAMLEKSIEAMLKAGNSKEAEFMIWLTAAARLHPHQICSFNDKGECTLRNPYKEERGEPEEVGEEADGQ